MGRGMDNGFVKESKNEGVGVDASIVFSCWFQMCVRLLLLSIWLSWFHWPLLDGWCGPYVAENIIHTSLIGCSFNAIY